jgi:hypothetical protein
MPKITAVYFDSISVFYNEYILRNLFWTKGIAKLGNVYVEFHNDPKIEYYDPAFNYYATQSVWAEIEEFCDSEAAWKFICDLNEGHAHIITAYAKYIECEPIIEHEIVSDLPEKDQHFSRIAGDLSNGSEITFDDLPPMQKKLLNDLFEEECKGKTSPYQIFDKDMSLFQQKLFMDLFTDLFSE